MIELLVLSATFLGVLIVSTLFINYLGSRVQVSSRLEGTARSATIDPAFFDQSALDDLTRTDSELIRNYFEVVRNDSNPNSLANRLVRAGYFSRQAVAVFQVARAALTVATFVSIFWILQHFTEASSLLVSILAVIVSGFAFFVANIVVERMGVKRETAYRRLFPDFMDMMIVCIDAGLSIEAAADRVAREFLLTSREFGVHLSIMMLEVRGGRRLRDALGNFAERLKIEEARSLAVLFRQSEELGSSVTKSLRVYSQEMRTLRLLKAEEKANALPIKMLFPLATFLFPMSILIVLVPIMIKVVTLLKSMALG